MVLELLFEVPGLPAPGTRALPPETRRRHGSEFALLPGTTLYSNFVATIDGVVELGDPLLSSGSAISGRNDSDRFLMGLLRAVADYILVGARTFDSEPAHAWTAESVYPQLAAEWRRLRQERGLAAVPTLLVATRSGSINRGHAAFGAQPVQLLDSVSALPPGAVLTEGGPGLMGSLLGRVDEVFVTLAPAVAGRASRARLGMIEGAEVPAPNLLQHRLLSLHRAESFLFARYGRV